MTRIRLCINVDHVATLRQARRGHEPDAVAAARLCEDAGADGITAHLREDRRHIQDADIAGMLRVLKTPFNLEMACTEEMIGIAERLKPHQVTLVPERREEVTTEGGLDLGREPQVISSGLARLKRAGIRTSVFIDPLAAMIAAAAALGADAIELHTGSYANARGAAGPLRALREGAQSGAAYGLAVHAGHGLTVSNVGAVSAIAEIEELNIGHSIVSQSVFQGLVAAVKAMRTAMDAGRSAGQ